MGRGKKTNSFQREGRLGLIASPGSDCGTRCSKEDIVIVRKTPLMRRNVSGDEEAKTSEGDRLRVPFTSQTDPQTQTGVSDVEEHASELWHRRTSQLDTADVTELHISPN